MQNEPTLQALKVALDRVGAVTAAGDTTRRALVRAAYIQDARNDVLAAQDAEARNR